MISWAEITDMTTRTALNAIVTYMTTKYAIAHSERFGKRAKRLVKRMRGHQRKKL